MAFSKIIAESMDLTDTYAFTGTVTGAGEANKPYFEAYTSGLQQTNHNTTTKLTFGTEAHDSNSDFASDRFTPTVAGKYFCYARATTDPASYNNERDSDLKFYFNGSAENSRFFSNVMVGNTTTSTGATATTHHTMGIITFNGSSDYLEVYARLFVHSGTDANAQFGKKVFGAFLLSTT
tara:strand:+ start:558 stop:1094 length:537 start_codon:yes stop_codon:yes gene_type:complete